MSHVRLPTNSPRSHHIFPLLRQLLHCGTAVILILRCSAPPLHQLLLWYCSNFEAQSVALSCSRYIYDWFIIAIKCSCVVAVKYECSIHNPTPSQQTPLHNTNGHIGPFNVPTWFGKHITKRWGCTGICDLLSQSSCKVGSHNVLSQRQYW